MMFALLRRPALRPTRPALTVLGAVAVIALLLLSGGLVAAAGSGSAAPFRAATAPAVAPLTPSARPTATGIVAPHHLQSIPLSSPRATNASLGYGNLPAWLAYQPADQSFWVADPSQNSVDVFNATYSPLGLNATLAAGTTPFAVAADPADGLVFVTNTGSHNVSVFSTVTETLVRTVAVGSDPHGIAYDPDTGSVFVANTGSDNVSVFAATTGILDLPVNVSFGPFGVAVDAASGQVFVTESNSSTVTALDGANRLVLANVPVGDNPYGVAVDNLTGNVYVTNQGSGNVSVIGGSSDQVVATIPVLDETDGLLQGIAYDSGTQQLWVGAGQVFAAVLNPGGENVSAFVGTDPAGVAYDPANGDVCLTNTANVTFECVAFPSEGPTTVPISFSETGLPSGTAWSVTMDYGGFYQPTASATAGGTVVFDSPPYYTWGYAAGTPDLSYAATTTTGSNVTVTTSGVAVQVTFVPVTTPVYDVNFTALGLPFGTAWWITFDGQARQGEGALQFYVPNGTYGWLFAGPGGPTATGYLTVDGAGTTVLIPSATASTYPVVFTETGLPTGTAWSVEVNGSTYTSTLTQITADLANGTYSWTVVPEANYLPNPSNGSVNVYGNGTQVSIAFAVAGPYTITFDESGLPSGTFWQVNLTNAIQLNSSASITYDRGNGTYWWIAYPVVLNSTPGVQVYYPIPNNGTVTIAGDSVTVEVLFATGTLYVVTFSESGLPAGGSWTVDLAGAVETTTATSLDFTVANGTYPFSVTPPTGYVASPSSGDVTVAGQSATVSVSLSPAPPTVYYSVTLVQSGLPNGTAWSASLAGVVSSSVTASILYVEPNGTYNLSVSAVTGYSVNYSSPVSVAGSNVTVAVTFSNTTYALTLAESGLSNGALWTASARNLATGQSTVGQSTGPTLTLHLLDGNYALTVAGPAGYSVALSVTSVTVRGGSPAPVQVAFTPPGPTGSTAAGPFALLTLVYVLTALVAGLAAVWGLLRYRSERWRSEGERWVEELRDEGRNDEPTRDR